MVRPWHTTATDDHPAPVDPMTGGPDPTGIAPLIGVLTGAAIGRIAVDPPISLDLARRDR